MLSRRAGEWHWAGDNERDGRSARGRLQKGAQRRDKPVELVVVQPVTGIFERLDRRVMEMGGKAGFQGVFCPAVLAMA